MSENWLLQGGFVLAASIAFVGCSSPVDDDTAQRAVIRDLANVVMYPWQGELAVQAQTVKTTIAAFCDAPTEANLNAAQTAWRATRVPLKHVEMLRFGPIEDLRIGSAIDFWPVRTESIEMALANAPDPITVEYIASLGTSTKGMPALEYLMFDPSGGNAAILVSLGGADAVATRRCAYARALGEAFANDTATLEAAWSPAGGKFVDQVANAGTGSTTFTSGQNAIARVVNLLNASLQVTNENKLGSPLGLNTGSPDPLLVESRFSDHSIEDLLENLHGVEDVYFGRHGDKSGQGLTVLVSARSAAIDTAVKQALTEAQSKVSAIPPPLRVSVTADSASVTATHAAIRALRIRLSTDVASVLGVSILLNDSDGD
jgi:predicted lipoprotein